MNSTISVEAGTRMESAIRYHKRGLPVVLCDGKKPLGGNEWQHKVWDESTIIKEFRQCPALNIGVKSGSQSGIDIEADSPEEEQLFLELFDGCEIPAAPTYKSARGKHRWFKWDDRLSECGERAVINYRGSSRTHKMGIRIGANGKAAQSIVPPSPGRIWVDGLSFDECDLPALPDKVVQRIIDASKGRAATKGKPVPAQRMAGDDRAIERCRKYVDKMPPAIALQGGDDQTFKVALALFKFGLSDDDARRVLEEYNQRCEPPWNDSVLEHKLRDAKERVSADGEFGCMLQNDSRQAKSKASGSNVTTAEVAKQFNLTDVGNAERFAEQHGSKIRFCHAWNQWLIWDGKRWAVDQTGLIERLAKLTAKSIYREAFDETINERREQIAKWAVQSERENRIRAMISLARSEPGIPVTPDQLDSQPMLFNVQNGTIDLRTGELQKHRRENNLTKICPVEYPTEPGVDCPVWEEFLHRIFDGNRDLIGFVQRLIGLALVGEVLEHVLPIFYGTGANGKGTFVEAILGMVWADYALKAPHGMLMARHTESHPTELADLYGKRFVAVVETEDGCRLAEALTKELTGGDTIRARRMREDYWSFRPSHLAVLVTNHKPVVRGTDHGIWRRLRLVPFNVTIPEAEQDPHLSEKLRAEYPAILRWAVEGCLAWRRDGLGTPEAVIDATSDYRSDSDIIGNFISECCITGDSYRVKASQIYAAYKAWAEQNGERPYSQRRFGSLMTDRGYERHRSGGFWYLGVDVDVQT